MKYRVRIKNPIIGVPITFLDKLNPEQFEIYGSASGWTASTMNDDWLKSINYNNEIISDLNTKSYAILNGHQLYHRLLIRWLPEIMPTIDEDGVILYASKEEN